MENLFIEKKKDSPEIVADGEKGLFVITGKSLPEDAKEFYLPLERYVQAYITNPQKKTTVNLRLEYLNSSSSKKLLDIMVYFEKLRDSGYEVEVNWFHNIDDQDILDEGVEFAHMTSLEVNFISEH